ncbi:16S rRNA (cytidine(1402)-2'-O)-methyltransferase [Aquirufa antheringensis]|jgi:16S rRNA (cytidine1402-2'-O)-methyltransferase|uniref:16S rRNA (cytidine(1402)-2'-O)-methyltransferase n=1 Tax=Aquirufa antheringensis TaxID=2516559 RepID=UPI0010328E88|nr:16S rRNA (cytidine(1402)-2'-O)-methyltransferase [Aquirufa antheringensis]MCL9968788.1 16S rRNA (cytidine(1402)-2'-O)-methyltransferase [Aquirufa antheringensis]MCZ2476613.1 16S rRNA (cytidine(1402)-2'-O)-methyltransferase [Aquirufa antheringensis]MCZ2483958.1 16S rRNA (cytidine(1402)-2'-O)-methyltransferase [Aquirufa antheringensis]MCZ2489083.1 16S rRNA (cytidine(1402)-2'-O)-methyltransferase [Aquirufa antheringensis]TBH70082.1 16S rRNA (cytidine(1402)-2'-O)-methyltransferase [Aquirufa ant
MKLYLVPTPIGNLEDITLRAIRVLGEVDGILAEDTRNSGQLLKHLNISKPLYSHHAHNEHTGVPGVIKMLKEGKSLALISDAGTPGISDPGYLLVKACVDNGIEVESLPGATAFVPALVNSGFPTDRFVYEGFLPHKKGRQTRWKALAEEERTIVLYESPHRLVKALEQIIEFISADRLVMVGREISKLHEQMVRGTATEVLAYFTAHPDKVRGEIVIVIAGK